MASSNVLAILRSFGSERAVHFLIFILVKINLLFVSRNSLTHRFLLFCNDFSRQWFGFLLLSAFVSLFGLRDSCWFLAFFLRGGLYLRFLLWSLCSGVRECKFICGSFVCLIILSFILLFVCSFVYSFVLSFIIRLFDYSFVCLIILFFFYSFVHLLICLFVRLFFHSFDCSCICLFVCSFFPLFTHSFICFFNLGGSFCFLLSFYC